MWDQFLGIAMGGWKCNLLALYVLVPASISARVLMIIKRWIICEFYHLWRGMTITTGSVVLEKDSTNLIGISIGGGAPYCPCLYIVQVLNSLLHAKCFSSSWLTMNCVSFRSLTTPSPPKTGRYRAVMKSSASTTSPLKAKPNLKWLKWFKRLKSGLH